MTIVEAFPESVQEIENTWIELSDGCRLAARIWMPESAPAPPVPAILEYLPYRKRDQTAPRDELTHPYMAGHGYACVRVDMRGNGDSDGLMHDEYLEQEQADCLEVIEWLTRRSWCDGSVGMMGISWGGFNALQLAARQPAALKAIVTVCSSDDRFADDVHYKGGCLLNENFSWGTTMMAFTSRPPDPALRPETWREIWLNRLRNLPFFCANWLGHQHRDAFWRHGSVCEDHGRIEAAVLAVGGWADAYTNTVPRLLEGLSCPRRGIIGPWIHKYPHFAPPEPKIGFLQEMLRWWDRWLKGIHNGVDQDPRMVAYVQDWAPPAAFYTERPGFWVTESAWPSERIEGQFLYLDAPRLQAPQPTESALRLRSPETTGTTGGRYCPIWTGPDLPTDQRSDDGCSLAFDTEPLAEAVTILGRPTLHVSIAASTPQANLAVRLNDVAPDGTTARVSYGVFNLAHHNGHQEPRALEPGERYAVSMPLDVAGHHFRAGHRIRVAVSTAYWPMIWSAPEATEITVFTGDSHLQLPVRTAASTDGISPFEEARSAPGMRSTWLRDPDNSRHIVRDATTGVVSVESMDDMGRYRIDDHSLEVETVARETYAIGPEDPASARAEAQWSITLARDGWEVRTETSTAMTSTADHFVLQATVRAYEGNECVFEDHWNREISRNHL